MTKTTTNLLGILITILAGTVFNLMLCNSCNADGTAFILASYPSDATFLMPTGVHVSGVTPLLTNHVPFNKATRGYENEETVWTTETHTNQP